MIYTYDTVTTVHLEITSKCNASCPMCGRNVNGGSTVKSLPLTELSLSQIKSIFPEDFIGRLTKFYMCGNYGDPATARDTVAVCEWLKTINPKMQLGLHTNGSVRSTDWWTRLAKCLSGTQDFVRFGIDGLEDTNHLYRKGTVWHKIMHNARTYIDAGGSNAQWAFLIFKHNEHQVDAAMQLSLDMGFTAFIPKKTSRFFNVNRHDIATNHPVISKSGNTLYYLEPPTDTVFKNESLQNLKHLSNKYGNMQAYLDQTKICCKVSQDKSVYVSAEGLVFPCCWTGYIHADNPTANQQAVLDLIDNNTDNISALNQSLKSIINGDFFRKIYNSWTQPSIADGKLQTCASICGQEFDRFKSQFS